MSEILNDACLCLGKAGSAINTAKKLGIFNISNKLSKFCDISNILTGASQASSILTTVGKIGITYARVKKFEKDKEGELQNAKSEAVGVINEHLQNDDKQLDAVNNTDSECKDRAMKLLKLKKKGEIQLDDDCVKKLVTYVALRGRISDLKFSVVRSIPGLLTNTLGVFSSFYTKDNNFKKDVDIAFGASQIITSVSKTGFRVGDLSPGGDEKLMTASFMWNEFKSIIANDLYGLKGLDNEIRSFSIGPLNRDVGNQIDQEAFRVNNVQNKYENLQRTMDSMYISVDSLIKAKDIDQFKERLVASAI